MHKFLSSLSLLLLLSLVSTNAMEQPYPSDDEKDQQPSHKRFFDNKKGSAKRYKKSENKEEVTESLFLFLLTRDEGVYFLEFLDLETLYKISRINKIVNQLVNNWIDGKIDALIKSEHPACQEVVFYFKLKNTTSKTLTNNPNFSDFILFFEKSRHEFDSNITEAAKTIFNQAYFDFKKILVHKTKTLPQLEEVDYDNKNLYILPKIIGTLTNLKKLSLKNNYLFFLPSQLTKNKLLIELSLRDNDFQHFPFSIINSLPALGYLNLSSNLLELVPHQILSKKDFFIDVSGNPLTKLDESSIEKFKEAAHLYSNLKSDDETSQINTENQMTIQNDTEIDQVDNNSQDEESEDNFNSEKYFGDDGHISSAPPLVIMRIHRNNF